ncbi:putative tail protein [Neorhizobium sp. R1-B]|uniref:phage tail protein n=1 Tax=Neorhizobium sp. R1-B TaxID=2485162 RepID=UPI0010EB2A17|nr:phage tail protein [Neorhizobium sp. R1-B]TDX72593.1 putative tail protein [Neorhizobium sp. R1-B]
MKLTKLLLASGATWAAMVSHAHADPVSLIATAIHGFLLSSTAIAATAAGTLATIAANVIVGGALVAGSLLLGGQRRGGAIKPSDAKNTFESGESSVIEGVGRVRVGGLQAFGNTDGSTRARLVCRLQGPVDAFETFYLGGREVIVESNGDVSSPPWARPGGSWANWQNKLGTGAETAWAGLMSLFPTLWTSDHRVRGIAQSQLLFYNPGLTEEKYLSLYQNGAPNSESIIRGSLIYDPRTGLTAWSDNSAIICAHVLRRDPAFTFERFNWTKIATTANAADVLVATRTGTEKRSRLWGMWAWESERGETMQQFLDSAGLEIRLDEDGLIYFEFIDDVIAPEIEFDPRDIYDYSWQSGPEAVERPNICRVKYYSPERNYELSDLTLEGIVAWAKIDDEVDRYGDKFFDLELPFCPSASQAQRIARRKFAIARADRGRMVTKMVGLAAWGLLYAEVEEPDLGDLIKVRMDPPRIDDENGSVEIPFTVWPTLAAWNPATDEAPAPDVIPELGYETDMITPNPPGAAIQITYPGGGKEMRIGYNLPAQPYTTVEANYRTYSGGLPGAWQSMAEFGGTVAGINGDFLGQTIDARVRVFNGDDGSYFSDPASLVVGVDNAPCGAPNLVSGGVVTDPPPTKLAVTVSAPEGRCAAIRLQRRVNLGAWSTVATFQTQPFAPVAFESLADGSSGSVTEWQIQTLTSNGTAGTPLIFSYTAP